MERNLSPMRPANLTAIVLSWLLFCASGAAQSESPSPLRDSVPQGVAGKDVIPISVSGAIDRALRHNLGIIVTGSEARVARAERLRALADLLPNVRADVTETVQQRNIAAFGFGGFPGVP